MISRVRQFLFAQPRYAHPIERQRANGLLAASWIFLLLLALWGVVIVLPALADGEPLARYADLSAPFALLAVIAVIALVRRGRLAAASWALVLALAALAVPPALAQFDTPSPALSSSILLVIPLAAGGVLLDRRGLVGLGVLTLLVIGARAYSLSQITGAFRLVPAQAAGADAALLAAALGLSLAFLAVFSGAAARVAGTALADGDKLREAATFVKQAAGDSEETAVLHRLTSLLSERLGYPIAQIYLLDESGSVIRRARPALGRQETGAAPQLRDGDADVIASVIAARQPVIVTPADDQRSHLVPPARAAVAIPVVHDGRVIGVLDAQTQATSFAPAEIAILSLLADQLAVALAQSRLVTDLRRALREQEDAASIFQSQLAALRQSSQQIISSGWTRYLEGQGQSAFGFDMQPESKAPVPATGFPEIMRAALETGELTVETRDDERIINLPISFRGETLGAMAFAIPKDQPLTDRHLDMAQIVASRLSLALENTRLYEQSQAQALRERKASEVAQQLISATDVRAVLNLAAESFNEALGAVYTRVYLQPELATEPNAPARSEEMR